MRFLRWLTYWPRRILAKWQGCLVTTDPWDIDEIIANTKRRDIRWQMYEDGYIVIRDEHTPEQDWHEKIEELFRDKW